MQWLDTALRMRLLGLRLLDCHSSAAAGIAEVVSLFGCNRFMRTGWELVESRCWECSGWLGFRTQMLDVQPGVLRAQSLRAQLHDVKSGVLLAYCGLRCNLGAQGLKHFVHSCLM